jgi:hypothetical protein
MTKLSLERMELLSIKEQLSFIQPLHVLKDISLERQTGLEF